MMTTGLYGNTTVFGGTYFEWFVFQQSATAPATPSGGSWDFQENTGLAPTGWTTAPPTAPTNTVWASIAIVNSRLSTPLVWTAPAPWVQQGVPGSAATVAVGTTTTLAPGSSATVANSGTSSAAVFNFGIPQGAAGANGSPGTAATIAAGTTTTLSPGASATVTNAGTSSAAVFNFGIPQGTSGTAATIAAGTTTTLAPGSSATVSNSGTSSAAVFNFGIPQGTTGAQGVPGINWLGTWSSGTTYAIRDAVAYLGSSYYAIASNTNQAPPNASFWELLAEKGANGTGAGSVTSVDVSGGTTGLTTSGGPVTSAGTITLAGTLAVANGGTGVTTSTGTGANVLSTSPALTTPSINLINDTSGNEILDLSPVASATDYFTVKNGIGVAVPLHLQADGPSANIGLHIQPKGTGLVTISDGTDFNKGIRFRSSSSAAGVVTLIDAVSSAGHVITLPNANTTLVGRDTTDTLTNKTIAFASNTLTGVQPTLVSGTSIKTINSTSVLGSGDIVTGDVTLTGTQTLTNKTIEFVDGTAAAPSITNVGDNNTGIFFPAADTIAFAEGGVEQMRLDASGNLGLGAVPSAWDTLRGFDIGSGGAVWGTAAQVGLASNNYYGAGGFRYKATNVAAALQVDGNIFKFFTAPSGTAGNAITFTQAMTLDANGNLGIGTTTPVAKFDLVGDYKEGVVTANTGTAYTINTATGTLQILTLTGNCTFTFPTATTGESFTLFLRQDGTGGRTVTWPANVRWPGGTAPTITSTASRQDKYIFTADGTNFYGSNAGQNYTV